MTRHDFEQALTDNTDAIARIRKAAHDLHADVNQHYDGNLPYSVHLDRAARFAAEYAHEVCQSADDVVPLLFGAYFHDSMEDARLTYNNVMRIARSLMTEEQAFMAAEIVYALTNEKGRNRAERANDKYYAGIRSTPYAPLCKMADRLANVSYSAENTGEANKPMLKVYAGENQHFIEALTSLPADADPRCTIPATMLARLDSYLKN